MDRESKELRKLYREDLKQAGGIVKYFPESGTTILVVPGVQNGKTVKVALAQASDNEPKFRRKFGELLAMQRWADGITHSIRVDFLSFGTSEDHLMELEFFADQYYSFVIGW